MPYKRGGEGILPIRCDQVAGEQGRNGVEELQRDDGGGNGHPGGQPHLDQHQARVSCIF